MIAIDCEPGLLNAVLAHLEQELSHCYPKKISSRGQRLSAQQLVSANLAADDLQALVEDKGQRYRVRMALPLFEANGYSYAYCSCRENQLDIEEQRCEHLWLTQQTLLQHLQKQLSTAKSQRPPWLALAEQLQEAATAEKKRLAQTSLSRLQWQLDADLSCTVFLQTYHPEKKAWTRKQKLSWKQLCSESSLWLTRADQALIARITQLFHGRSFNDEPLQAFSLLEDLCEHPEVYHADGTTPLKLAKADLSLQVEVSRSGLDLDLHLGSVPLAQLLLFANEGLCGFSAAAACLYLCRLTPELSELALSLRSPERRHTPAAHKHALLDQLAAFQTAFATHMYSPDLPTQQHNCQQDSRSLTYLRLTPLSGQGLIAEFLLKPLPAASYPRTYLRPGEGPDCLWDCGPADALVLYKRDLASERAAALTLAQELGLSLTLSTGLSPAQPCIWQLPTDTQALDLLASLQAYQHKERVIIEWPEDAVRPPYEVVTAKAEQDLKIEVAKKQDWFSLHGELCLDGQKVDLLTLLQAFRKRHKYLKLANGKWLRLCALLEKRLAELDPCLPYGSLQAAKDLRLSPAALASAQTPDGLLSSALKEQLKALREKRGRPELSPEDPLVPSVELRAELRPYQQEGFRWLARLYELGLGGILADDMGLGKTLQTIALLQKYADAGPSLILCPASVQANWDAELRRFAPNLRPVFYREQRQAREALTAGVIVIGSYGLLLSSGADFSTQRWNIIVADEAQYIKNAASKTAQQLRALQCHFALALTGTPIENSIHELWSLFHWANPELLGSWQQFREFFLGQSKTPEEAEQKQEKLRQLIRPFLLRRLKAAHLHELPPKSEIALKIYLTTEERRFYDKLRMEAIAALKADEVLLADSEEKGAGESRVKFKALAYLTKLRQLVCHPRLLETDWSADSSKALEFYELSQRLLAGGHKALVFSQFPSFLKILQEKIKPLHARCLHLDGATALKERENLVKAFQAGDADFFFISLKAGGTGLNLTAADYVLHMDPWWNPAVEAQATDRAHRMGQKKPVTIYRFITQLSVEDKILALHAEKRGCAETLLQGTGAASQLSLSDLKELFHGEGH